MNQDQTIAKLRQALVNILACRTDWCTSHVDVVQDIREIARKALDETEISPEQTLVSHINRCEEIIDTDADWEIKYDVIFEIHGNSIRPLLQELGYRFDYYDPDTTYQEDVVALVNALAEVKKRAQTAIELKGG